MKIATGAFIVMARNRASLSRSARSAWRRSVTSMAMPPIMRRAPSGPGMGNLLTSEWCTPSSCSSVSMVSTPVAAASAARSLARNCSAVCGREDLRVGPAVKLGSRFAERALGGVVRENVSALLVLDPRQAGQMLHEAREALFAAGAIGDVEQHVDGASDSAIGVEQRLRVGDDPAAGAVGALNNHFLAVDRPTFADDDGHGALIGGKSIAVGSESADRAAPRCLADFGRQAPEFDGGVVVELNSTECVAGVDGGGQSLDEVAVAAFAVAELLFDELASVVVVGGFGR